GRAEQCHFAGKFQQVTAPVMAKLLTTPRTTELEDHGHPPSAMFWAEVENLVAAIGHRMIAVASWNVIRRDGFPPQSISDLAPDASRRGTPCGGYRREEAAARDRTWVRAAS